MVSGDPPYSVAVLDPRFSAFSSSRARLDIGLGRAFRNSGGAPKPRSARASATAQLRKPKICHARFYACNTRAPVSCMGCSLLGRLPNERYALVSARAPTRSRLSHDCSAGWCRYPRATRRLVPMPVSFVVHSFTSFFYSPPLPPVSRSCREWTLHPRACMTNHPFPFRLPFRASRVRCSFRGAPRRFRYLSPGL